MKGISPLIAVVLLIAFTVAVAGILNLWLMGFARESTETIGSEATKELVCSYGGLSLGSVSYNSTTTNLTGNIENTGTIPLGDISIQILYTNASVIKTDLCIYGIQAQSCPAGNMTLSAREKYSFNIDASGSNYDKVRVISNCSSVFDEITSSEVSSS